MSSVASRIGSFKADPGHGSFRAWLLQNVCWKIVDQLRKRMPFAAAGAGGPGATGTARTSTVDRVPDVREMDLDGLCDAEWRERLRALVYLLRHRVGRVLDKIVKDLIPFGRGMARRVVWWATRVPIMLGTGE